MTTLTALADTVQLHLADSAGATWPQATVEAWVLEAIKEYSIHFPRVLDATYNCAAGDRSYDLALSLVDVLSVEYPAGEDPPVYLQRRRYTDAGFWQEAGYYDLVRRQDATGYPELWISEAPSAGEQIKVIYTAPQDSDMGSTDPVTVPAVHHHLITAYAVWLAWRERASAQAADPDTTTLMLSQYASNASRAWREYTEALNRARSAQAPGGWAARWPLDGDDRIY